MGWLDTEYGQVDFGDRRLNRRVYRSAQAIAAQPSLGFTEIFACPSQLEGHYRLMNNPRVSADALLAPHHDAVWGRVAEEDTGSVVIAHDTSEFVFKGEVPRKRLTAKSEGSSFYGHFALAVSESKLPIVHGVVGQGVYRVCDKLWVEGQQEETEVELLVGSDRWLDVATRASAQAPDDLSVIHVMDREADDYPLMTGLMALGDSFVIRAQHDRVLVGKDTDEDKVKLFGALNGVEFQATREIHLSRRGRLRPPATRKAHPERGSRKATLSIRAGEVTISRPRKAAPLGEPSMALSFVEIVEVNPPEGKVPVLWRLLTNLPTSTQKQIERVVDIYRKRWLIEEFFKALKTGCSAEKRQGRSLYSLWNTIAMLVPVAWRILRLRVSSRIPERLPASTVVDPIELRALREMVPKNMLSPRPDAVDVTLAIARVGGHLPSNGPPGWLTLGRGMEKLHTAAGAWRAALKLMGKSGEFTL